MEIGISFKMSYILCEVWNHIQIEYCITISEHGPWWKISLVVKIKVSQSNVRSILIKWKCLLVVGKLSYLMQNFQLDVRGCILSTPRTSALHLSTLIVEELKYNLLLNSVICYEWTLQQFCLNFDLYTRKVVYFSLPYCIVQFFCK